MPSSAAPASCIPFVCSSDETSAGCCNTENHIGHPFGWPKIRIHILDVDLPSAKKLQQAAQPARLIRHADGDDLAGREDKSVLAQYAARLRLVAGNEAQHAVIARLGNINRA